MGKITLEMIAKSPSHTKKRRDETVQQYIRRLTHLYFSEKNIDEIVSSSETSLFHWRKFCFLCRQFRNVSSLLSSYSPICVYGSTTSKESKLGYNSVKSSLSWYNLPFFKYSTLDDTRSHETLQVVQCTFSEVRSSFNYDIYLEQNNWPSILID